MKAQTPFDPIAAVKSSDLYSFIERTLPELRRIGQGGLTKDDGPYGVGARMLTEWHDETEGRPQVHVVGPTLCRQFAETDIDSLDPQDCVGQRGEWVCLCLQYFAGEVTPLVLLLRWEVAEDDGSPILGLAVVHQYGTDRWVSSIGVRKLEGEWRFIHSKGSACFERSGALSHVGEHEPLLAELWAQVGIAAAAYLRTVDAEARQVYDGEVERQAALKRPGKGTRSQRRAAANTLPRWRVIWVGETNEARPRRVPEATHSSPTRHYRRGHFHRFWVGTRVDSEGAARLGERLVLKWVAPLWVDGPEPTSPTRTLIASVTDRDGDLP